MTQTEQWSTLYRPRTLKSVIGNQDTVKLVERFMEQRNGHAILLSGPSGCGKTTMAQIIGKHYAGMKSNYRETNASSDSGIDDVRSMIEASRYLPTNKDGCKVFVLEEVHGLTKKAASALLRPIEEPPHNQLLWILVTDKPWMLDTTILTRCRKFPVSLPDEKEVARYLMRVAKKEEAFSDLEEEELKKICIQIARAAGNIPREAIQILQNAHDSKVKDYVSLKKYVVQSAAAGDVQMDKVAAAILIAMLSKTKSAVAVKTIVQEYAKVDSMGLLTRCVFQLHSLLIFALGGKSNVYYAIRTLVDGLKDDKPSIESIVLLLRVLGKTRNDLKEVVLDPSTIILPTILDCTFKLKGE